MMLLFCFSYSQSSAWSHQSYPHRTKFPTGISKFCVWWLAERTRT